MHIPRLARGNDIDMSRGSRRGSRQGIVKCSTLPPPRSRRARCVEPPRRLALSRRWRGSLDPGNPPSHTARPPSHHGATLDPGWCSPAATAPLIQGGGSPRRRHEGPLPRAEIGGLRRAAAMRASRVRLVRAGSRSGHRPPWPPAAHPCTGRSIPRCRSPPPNGQPQPPTKSRAARRLFLREEASPPGASSRSSYSGASGAGMASARRPPLLPHPAPNGS
jgi:hypothetical protein